MLCTVICVLLIVLGFVLIDKFYSEFFGSIIFVVGIGGTIICALLIVFTQLPKQANYEKSVMHREMLEYRIEHQEDNQIGNELLYSEILEFNQKVYSAKKWSQNPWVNWFVNDKIAELDYIEYSEQGGEPV